MFDLFNRRQKLEKEAKFLVAILEKLPNEDPRLRAQLEAGIIRGIKPCKSRIEFCLDPKVARQFESVGSSSYSIEGIRIADRNSAEVIQVELHVAFGLIAGYSASTRVERLDPQEIDVSNARKKFKFNADFEFAKSKLQPAEWSPLDPDGVHRVNVEGSDIMHLMAVEGEDFIGMDLEGKLFLITHNPVEWIRLDKKLDKAMLELMLPVEVRGTTRAVAATRSPSTHSLPVRR